jgi:tetrahydromethanopterin S-methyltransferase subunit C
MGKKKKTGAVEVYYPDRDKPSRVDVDLSVSGAKKGSIIGAALASRIPHPAAMPVGFIVGGIVGAVIGKPD